MSWDFAERLAFSRGRREHGDFNTIMAMIPGCVQVRKSDQILDQAGVDYIATLRKGAEILIDGKARDKGASRYWRHKEPELALEVWSVMPGGKYHTPTSKQKTGWTLCEKKNVDLILFTFDPTDSNEAFLIGFQPLRIAFRQNMTTWENCYVPKPQDNGSYESLAIFVPVSKVWEAIRLAGTRHTLQV